VTQSVVFFAVASIETDKRAVARELRDQIDVQVIEWRAKHPGARLLSAETHTTANQYCLCASHTLVFE
jgi:hypothetical protein